MEAGGLSLDSAVFSDEDLCASGLLKKCLLQRGTKRDQGCKKEEEKAK